MLNSYMKKHHLLPLVIIPTIFSISSCGTPTTHYNYVEKLADYVYEVPAYTSLDYDFADKYFENNYDNWGGGCSAIAKEIDGDMIVGRNMDLNISNKCAYIVKTKANLPDEYDTIGLSYTFRGVSPDYSEVLAHNGIDDTYYKILPFMCDDVLNSEGLYIEINMRNAECWPNGEDKFSCEGTSALEDARKVYMFEIPRYVGSHCDTVESAVSYISDKLDIYGKAGYWNYSFLIADATGECVLVEIGKDVIYYSHKEALGGYVAQTNFYRNDDLYAIQDTKTGLGRLEWLMDNIDGVTSKEEMFQLMDEVSYFQFYEEACLFDYRSELLGMRGEYTYDFIYSQSQQELERIRQYYVGLVKKLNREQLRNLNEFWETTFTEVVDCNNKEIYVRIFEQADTPYITTIRF